MRTLQWITLVATALAPACSSGGTSPEPETPTAVANVPPPPPATETETETEPAMASAPLPDAGSEPEPDMPLGKKLPRPGPAAPRSSGPALGEPCPGAASGGVDPCGTRGRVALEADVVTVRLIHGAPCKPEKLKSTTSVHVPKACVDGDVIYAANVCVACRLVHAGWSAKGRVPEMTQAHALEVQKQLGLSTTRPLSTVEEWKLAIAGARAP